MYALVAPGKRVFFLLARHNGIQDIKEYPDDLIDDDDNIPYDIGVSINVPIDPFTSELRVKVSGYERDSGFNGENDILPAALSSFPCGTPGFSGADLANVVNEAALVAAHLGRRTVSNDDLHARATRS